jgi:RNA polymerase sigma-70 factor (ECF subfamily)
LISDTDIITGCKQGRPEAQKLLYLRHAPFLKGVCIRYIKDRDIVSDILQDAFIKIFSNIRHLKEDNAIEAWLRRIVVNTCLDHLKRAKLINEQAIVEDEMPSMMEEDSSTSDEGIVNKILESGFTKEQLIKILQELPENYSRVFNMFYIDDMSHREIAEIFNITEGLSRKWIFRARDLIRKSLECQLQNSKADGSRR